MNVYTVFLAKDLRDVRRTPQVLAVFLLMPFVCVFIMSIFAFAAPEMMKRDANDPVMQMMLRQVTSLPEFSSLAPDAAFTAYVLRTILGFFLLMPIVLSSTMAVYSVVGEKQQRTLEPLLATPISDRQLLLGKLIASLAPALFITWLAGVVAATITAVITWSRWHQLIVPDHYWFLALFVLAPVVGAASVLATMRLSARSTDPQSAMQTTGLLLVPAFLVLVGGVGKVLLASVTAVFVVAALFVLIDVWLFRHNERKFAREEILTRWR